MKLLTGFNVTLVDPKRIKRKVVARVGQHEGGVVIGFDMASCGKNTNRCKRRYWVFSGSSLTKGVKCNISSSQALIFLGCSNEDALVEAVGEFLSKESAA